MYEAQDLVLPSMRPMSRLSFKISLLKHSTLSGVAATRGPARPVAEVGSPGMSVITRKTHVFATKIASM